MRHKLCGTAGKRRANNWPLQRASGDSRDALFAVETSPDISRFGGHTVIRVGPACNLAASDDDGGRKSLKKEREQNRSPVYIKYSVCRTNFLLFFLSESVTTDSLGFGSTPSTTEPKFGSAKS